MRALNFHQIITFPSVSESISKCRSKDMVVVNHRILFQCPLPIYELQTPRCLSTQFVSICSCKYANYSLCSFLILYLFRKWRCWEAGRHTPNFQPLGELIHIGVSIFYFFRSLFSCLLASDPVK